ncbi:xanthine dehydrogenase YagR molybdenum-binding subunit [Pseudonocardia hierapolitana]|uniref:Xanthine dehydrogenase YagR molybdenum-binding subunit n=1 Tax=Pseudonocardia hierapolitana TaxID=1128676 RepID=A0A561SJT1_9PSEU|nr:xanthine dehydrogenase YagR molybdenum-binding subunit [Pseudonocardia hierapolitana]
MTTMVGRPIARLDGDAKVTGAARYAADVQVAGLTHGTLVMSTIARGRIARIDTRAAEAAPGVLAVLTHRTMPRLALPNADLATAYFQRFVPVQDDVVRYAGQPIAVVVAGTLEQAQHAATLVDVEYAAEQPAVTLAEGMPTAYVPPPTPVEHNDVVRGDPDAGFAAAHAVVDAEYLTPLQHHNSLEPSATVAQWDGDRLTVHESAQYINATRNALAQAFRLPPANVRVLSPYLGGGFGSKGPVWPHTLLTAAAARRVGQPVKLVLTRAQTYTSNGHRAATHQRLRIGADRDGRLTAIEHVLTQHVSRTDEFMGNGAEPIRMLYAVPNLRSTQRAVRLDMPTQSFVRSPETAAVHALESALDELAVALGVDPVELRIRNHSAINQDTGVPHGSNHLVECYRRGAEAFGWARRDPRPGSMRDGDALVGWGMATAAHTAGNRPGAGVRVALGPDGTATVQCATHDIGTGTSTVMTQVAADTLGMHLHTVTFELGDTDFPPAFASAASSTVPAVGPASCGPARRRGTARSPSPSPIPVHPCTAWRPSRSGWPRGTCSPRPCRRGGSATATSWGTTAGRRWSPARRCPHRSATRPARCSPRSTSTPRSAGCASPGWWACSTPAGCSTTRPHAARPSAGRSGASASP